MTATRCISPLEKALGLREGVLMESQGVKEEALINFFSKNPYIEEVTVACQLLEGQYSYHFEVMFPQCKVKRCGCLIPIPVMALQDNAQLYSDIGELLLTLSLLRGVLVDGGKTFCRLNYVP
jgi:hypothetical protein